MGVYFVLLHHVIQILRRGDQQRLLGALSTWSVGSLSYPHRLMDRRVLLHGRLLVGMNSQVMSAILSTFQPSGVSSQFPLGI